MRRYPDAIAAASWDSVVFDLVGHESLLRVPTLEPTRGTREHVGAVLESSPTAEELVAALMAE
jgi:proteasome accessory factor A